MCRPPTAAAWRLVRRDDSAAVKFLQGGAGGPRRHVEATGNDLGGDHRMSGEQPDGVACCGGRTKVFHVGLPLGQDSLASVNPRVSEGLSRAADADAAPITLPGCLR